MLDRFLIASYRFFYAVGQWRRRRFTPGGLMIAGVVMLAVVMSLSAYRSLIYQLLSLACVFLLLSFFWPLFFRGRFEARRILPRFATAGEPLAYRIRITNLDARRQGALRAREVFEDPRPDLAKLKQTPEPGEHKRNAWDRRVMWHRWEWLIRQNRKARAKAFDLPDLPPQDGVEIRTGLVPIRRGYLYFQGLMLTCPDPFGLFNAVMQLDLSQKLLILPRRYHLPKLNLPGGRKYHQGGVALASSVGNSEEFVAIREYRPGDPLRQIHWKSWAKFDKPIIKEFQDEFFVRHALILDTFLSPAQSARNRPLFEEAVSVAASFVCTIETRESLLDLMFVGDRAYCFSSGRGVAHADNMMEILAVVDVCIDKPFASLLPLFAGHASRLSGCICVLLTWDDERAALLRQMQSLSLPSLGLVLVDPREPGFDLPAFEAQAASGKFGRLCLLDVNAVQEGLEAL